jgi:hypothetical protein
MQAQLEELEKAHSIEWQDFEIGDFFDIGTGSLVDIKKAKKGETPRISVQTGNNGILGYYSEPLENARYFENFISVNFFGNAYYHPYRASLEMKVHTLTPKEFKLSEPFAFFAVTSLNQKLMDRFSYGSQLSSSKLKNDNLAIQLPTVTKNGDVCIAFDYMVQFVATLKAERLATLKAYLAVTGLSNTTLTAEEQKALGSLDSLTWQMFKLESLFGKATRGRRLKSADRIKGNLPFVTAGESETGISAWIGNSVHVFSKNTVTIDMFGSAKYRGYDYGADDHIAVVHTDKLRRLAVQFLVGCIHKSSHAGQFDYSRNFYAKDADELQIQLPVTANGTPDYAFMETLISAMQKVVIKQVVAYLDERIDTTQSLV